MEIEEALIKASEMVKKSPAIPDAFFFPIEIWCDECKQQIHAFFKKEDKPKMICLMCDYVFEDDPVLDKILVDMMKKFGG